MGSNKQKKLLSKILLSGVILTMVGTDIAPAFSYAKDVHGFDAEVVSESDNSPESTEEPVIEESKEELESVNDEIVEDAQEDVGDEANEQLDDNTGGNVIEEETTETIEIEDKETEVEGVKEESKVSTMTMRATVQEENTYVMATDADFSGTTNGNFRYIGDDEYVEIPHKIKGVNVTSYSSMFNESKVKGVKSTNTNILSMFNMFRDYKGISLDVSQLNTTSVKDFSYMFSSTIHQQTNLRELIGLDTFDTSNATAMNRMFYRSMITDIDVSSFDTSKVANMEAMFSETQDVHLDVSNLNTSNVNNMANMFSIAVTRELDVSNFDTTKVTNMSYMFNELYATELTGIESFNTERVTNMNSMFRYTKSNVINTRSFNTANVTNMGSMFAGVVAEELDLTNFDTSKVTTMNSMFSESKAKRVNVSSFNTKNVKAMNSMFRGADAVELDLRSFDTTNVTDMIYMFRNSTATKINVSSFDTSNVEKMTQMFHNSRVEDLDLSGFSTNKVTDMGQMFQDSRVKKIDLSTFNTSRLTDMSSMFSGSYATEIIINNFDTTYVTNMNSMFKDSKVRYIDLSSFDMRSVNDTDSMFENTSATGGLARSGEDVEKLNKSKGKPSNLNFTSVYKIAKDEDFSGFYNGIFKYIGTDEYVEVPNTIKGTKVTSYKGMFENSNVKGVISTNPNVTDMGAMFRGNSSSILDVSNLNTENVVDMSDMFRDTQATTLDVGGFETRKTKNYSSMFRNTRVNELDLGSFDLTTAINLDGMFQSTSANIGYARTQEDAGKLMKSLNKPSGLVFTVWGIQTNQNTTEWTNQPVELAINAVSDKYGIDYVEMVNETGRNYLLNSKKFNLFNSNNGTTHPMSKGYDSDVGANWIYGRYIPTNVYSLSTYINPTYSGGRGTQYSEELYPLPDTITYSISLMSTEPMEVTFNGTDSWIDNGGVKLEPNKWTRLTRTITKPDAVRPASLRVYEDPNIPIGTKLYYKDYKIEKGGTATPWKPAPEDSESSTGKQDTFNIYDNGTYIFRATDTLGNTKTVSHTVSNIDTTQPTATLTSSPEGWTSQEVKIYVNAKDELSGISHITLPNGEKVYKDTVEYPVSSNGTYTFTVTDKAGNTTTYKEEVTNIDKSIPKIESNVDNTKWTTETVGIDVLSGDSASGIKDIQLVSSPLEGRNLLVNTGELKQVTFSGWQNYFPDVHLSTVGLDELRKGGNFRFQGHVDNLKGEDDVGLMLHLATSDTTYLQYATSNTNQVPIKANSSGKVYMELNLDANKDIKTGYVALRHISINAKSSTATMSKVKLEVGGINTPWTPAPEDIQLKGNSKHYPVASNGLYTFKATYNNGSTSETSVNVTNIDRTAPGVTIKGNVEDWTEEDKLTLSINATDTQSGVKSITLPDGKVVSAKTATFDVTKNGEYEFIVMDNVGNTTKHTETVEYMMIPYSFYMYDKNGVPVKGVEFELMRNGEYYKTAISDVNGLVTFGKVPPDGKYQVRQVTAPGGVVLDPKDIENGDFTEPVEVVTYPRGLELPGTGTSYVLVVSGVIGLTLLGIAKVRSKRKKLRGKDVQR